LTLTIDPLWLYLAVPVVLVSALIVIKKVQRKIDQNEGETASQVEEQEEAERVEEEATEGSVEDEQTRAKAEISKEKPSGQDGCPHYLGYLYMKKGRESEYIPYECYSCRKLLQCLYSPNVIEKIYGE